MIKRLNHIALAVEDIEAALTFWRDTLGLPLERVERVESQQAEVAFLPVGDGEIELVRSTADDSGLARFLNKRGPGMHHIALEVDDLDAMLARLKTRGVRLIDDEPMPAAGGARAAFIHPESAFGVLVELYEIREQ
ncbi:MAG: methylmalonyl-CoA epimerase [Anaerolineales bacterium]